jgi:hypothetical protein
MRSQRSQSSHTNNKTLMRPIKRSAVVYSCFWCATAAI